MLFSKRHASLRTLSREPVPAGPIYQPQLLVWSISGGLLMAFGGLGGFSLTSHSTGSLILGRASLSVFLAFTIFWMAVGATRVDRAMWVRLAYLKHRPACTRCRRFLEDNAASGVCPGCGLEQHVDPDDLDMVGLACERRDVRELLKTPGNASLLKHDLAAHPFRTDRLAIYGAILGGFTLGAAYWMLSSVVPSLATRWDGLIGAAIMLVIWTCVGLRLLWRINRHYTDAIVRIRKNIDDRASFDRSRVTA